MLEYKVLRVVSPLPSLIWMCLFNSIEAKNVDKYICFDGNEDITIDLRDY